ncbi:MAG TPA: 6-bladed beta-propeller [Candidatus Manganitrophaceae bacterium]|nr:6-bladed beta-propeller [Candidatus Manganitrophaceae bacterium]
MKTKTRPLFRNVLIGAILLALAGCAAAPVVEKGPPIFWPQPPDPPKITFVQSLSEPKDIGIKPSWFKKVIRFLFGEEDVPRVVRPSGIAVDEEGGVYIADTGVQVVHYFNQSPPTYRQFFNLGPGERLQNPIGVAVDGAKQLYVSDSDLNRIFVFDLEGKLRRVIGNDEELQRVSGIAIDRGREILYAVDTLGHQVIRYSFLGEKKGVIGKRGVGNGEFNFPTYAAVDREGMLYVSDSLNFRVQVFDPEGHYQAQMGSLGSTLGQFSRPKGVAVDGASHIYVVDTLFDNVQIFNSAGELLLHFGKSGIEPGSFWLPAGIAIDRKGRIYVADSYNQRVQVFQLLEDRGLLPAHHS